MKTSPNTYTNQAKPQFKPTDDTTQTSEPKGIRIDGYAQVLDMLRVADESFRESLLTRLASRDRDLARLLRQELYIK